MTFTGTMLSKRIFYIVIVFLLVFATTTYGAQKQKKAQTEKTKGYVTQECAPQPTMPCEAFDTSEEFKATGQEKASRSQISSSRLLAMETAQKNVGLKAIKAFKDFLVSYLEEIKWETPDSLIQRMLTDIQLGDWTFTIAKNQIISQRDSNNDNYQVSFINDCVMFATEIDMYGYITTYSSAKISKAAVASAITNHMYRVMTEQEKELMAFNLDTMKKKLFDYFTNLGIHE